MLLRARYPGDGYELVEAATYRGSDNVNAYQQAIWSAGEVLETWVVFQSCTFGAFGNLRDDS